MGPLLLNRECNFPHKLLVGESLFFHLHPRQLLLEQLNVFNEFPDFLDGELVPSVLDILQLDFTGFEAFFLVLKNVLKKRQPVILRPRQPYVHCKYFFLH
jgi:hypothetical protein